MLAELLQIARNLRAQGIRTNLVHRDFGVPGLSSYTTLKAVLNEEGEIIELAKILKDEEPGLWTLKRGNFQFFPAVRLPNAPLAIGSTDELWAAFAKRPSTESMQALIEQSSQYVCGVDLSALRDAQAVRILEWQGTADDKSIEQIKRFATAFVRFASSPDNVSQNIVRATARSLRLPIDDAFRNSLLTLLVGQRKVPRNKKASVEYKVQLCFELKLTEAAGFSLYTSRMKRVVLECLLHEQSPSGTEIEGRCALTGESVVILSEPYPDWSAPPIISQPLKPFSKFSDAKCNYRYNRADSDAFAVGTDTANQLVAALKAITDNFRGTVWRPIKNGKIEERNGRKSEAKDVLIAYPTCPIGDLAVVDLFAPPEVAVDATDSVRAAKEFSEVAEPVCKAFGSPVMGEVIEPYLILLLIRQISPGQIQLAYSSTPSLTEFVHAIEDWMASGNNLPTRLRVPFPSKKSLSGYGFFKPSLLFPEDISRLLSYQWIRNGAESTRIEGPSVGTVLDLFLRKHGVWQDAASNLLELTLTRAGVLLAQAGHVLHRDDRESFDLWKNFVLEGKPAKERRHPDYAFAQTISLIGSLLYAMNSKIVSYENESAYLVGKLLAMMDELHKCYCIAVRSGDIPNALIGNGLLGRASESPARALEELCDRSRIYLGWAKSAMPIVGAPEKVKIAINSARKLLRIAAPLCEQLHTDPAIDKPLESVQKAHLFLGYLSPVLGKDEDGVP